MLLVHLDRVKEGLKLTVVRHPQELLFAVVLKEEDAKSALASLRLAMEAVEFKSEFCVFEESRARLPARRVKKSPAKS